MTWDESHVSVGVLLGTTQLGQILDKKSEFCGAYNRKDVMEYEVDHIVKQQSTTKSAQQSHSVA